MEPCGTCFASQIHHIEDIEAAKQTQSRPQDAPLIQILEKQIHHSIQLINAGDRRHHYATGSPHPSPTGCNLFFCILYLRSLYWHHGFGETVRTNQASNPANQHIRLPLSTAKWQPSDHVGGLDRICVSQAFPKLVLGPMNCDTHTPRKTAKPCTVQS